MTTEKEPAVAVGFFLDFLVKLMIKSAEANYMDNKCASEEYIDSYLNRRNRD
jgi:hypothetical protein